MFRLTLNFPSLIQLNYKIYHTKFNAADWKILPRKQVEKNLRMDLSDSKSWINEQILTIYGQMDEPSLILDYLLLGTEWNACNLEELQENGSLR